ncbi:MAG: Dabb family protein [Hyphomonadaceae bacterium]|nr:Dabb family protein [Clostridia bacterium]
MVMFNLKHDRHSPQAIKFLTDGKNTLTQIPGVKQFEVLTQISAKNDYHFGFSMMFENQAAYEAYNQHPLHVAFVNERWKAEVTRFLEMDFQQAL